MPEDFLYSAEELRIHSERKEQERKDRDKKTSDLRAVLATPEGRRDKWRELTEIGLFRTSFHVEPTRMAFLEGRKSIGYGLIEDLELARPGTFFQMFNEFYSVAPKEKE